MVPFQHNLINDTDGLFEQYVQGMIGFFPTNTAHSAAKDDVSRVIHGQAGTA